MTMAIPEEIGSCFKGDVAGLEPWSATLTEIVDLAQSLGLRVASGRISDHGVHALFLLRHPEWNLQVWLPLPFSDDDQFLMRAKFPFLAVKRAWMDICEARFRDIIAPLSCP